MPIEFTHLHNLVRTYQRSLHVNESMKPSTSGTNAEVNDLVSISGEARDEHRLEGVDVDADSNQAPISEQV
ncbi:MAG: hypothetical protein M3Z35_11045 [Nitrospirota bacterium]|nr:hypothetical protein [Nitrospirota bacterium]